MNIYEMSLQQLHNSRKKNEKIGLGSEDFLAFLNNEVTNGEELSDIFQENDFLKEYDVVVFGETSWNGEVNWLDLLREPGMQIHGMVIRRSVFMTTGCFNERLEESSDYEFLVRVSKTHRVFMIPVEVEEPVVWNFTKEFAKGLAYVLRMMLQELTQQQALEEVYGTFLTFFDGYGLTKEFENSMSELLDCDETFTKIAQNTAPFFIISGDDTCHGVLKGFADELGAALVKMGQAVIATDQKFGRFDGFEHFSQQVFKGIIGFQSPVLEKDFFRNMSCKKLQFWFDNPGFFDELLHQLPQEYYLLCQDGFYADFMKRYYGIHNAIQFPPAGIDANLAHNVEREYDVVFIGAYNPVRREVIADDFQQEFMEYMIAHPSNTFEQGLGLMLCEKECEVSSIRFCEVLNSLHFVCKNVINHYRHKVVETLLLAGIPLDVFGDTWYSYEGGGKENLRIHPAVSVEESLQVWGHAKVGLNVMTWHKNGMTERIANIMLSGAVCVSDETVYLREHFREDEEIVLFDLEHIGNLPDKILSLLADEELRNAIAYRAYQNASSNHTWKQRAEQLLELVDNE